MSFDKATGEADRLFGYYNLKNRDDIELRVV